MTIDDSTLIYLARLARLHVAPADRDHLLADLVALLGLVGRLASVPTDGIEPLAHPGDLRLRPVDDVVTEGDRAEELLALSDTARSGYYTVPKVIE